LLHFLLLLCSLNRKRIVKTATSQTTTNYLLLHQIILNRLICDRIRLVIGIPERICCCCASPDSRILTSNQADQGYSLLKGTNIILAESRCSFLSKKNM
jgi:hypothetical protein